MSNPSPTAAAPASSDPFRVRLSFGLPFWNLATPSSETEAPAPVFFSSETFNWIKENTPYFFIVLGAIFAVTAKPLTLLAGCLVGMGENHYKVEIYQKLTELVNNLPFLSGEVKEFALSLVDGRIEFITLLALTSVIFPPGAIHGAAFYLGRKLVH